MSLQGIQALDAAFAYVDGDCVVPACSASAGELAGGLLRCSAALTSLTQIAFCYIYSATATGRASSAYTCSCSMLTSVCFVDGLRAEARVGVAGTHRGLIEQTAVWALVQQWLQDPPVPPDTDPAEQLRRPVSQTQMPSPVSSPAEQMHSLGEQLCSVASWTHSSAEQLHSPPAAERAAQQRLRQAASALQPPAKSSPLHATAGQLPAEAMGTCSAGSKPCGHLLPGELEPSLQDFPGSRSWQGWVLVPSAAQLLREQQQ